MTVLSLLCRVESRAQSSLVTVTNTAMANGTGRADVTPPTPFPLPRADGGTPPGQGREFHSGWIKGFALVLVRFGLQGSEV